MTNKIRGFEVAKGFEDKDINLPIRATKGSAGYDFEAAEDIIIPSIWDIFNKAKSDGYELMGKEFFGKNNIRSEYVFMKEFENIQESDPEKMDIKALMHLMTVGLKIMEKMGKQFDITEKEIMDGDFQKVFDKALTIDSSNFFLDIFSEEGLKNAKNTSKKFKPVLVSTGVKAYMQDGEYLKIVNRSSNPLKRGLILTNGVGIVDKDYYSNPDNDGHIMAQFLNFSYDPIEIKKGERIFQGIFQSYLVVDDDNATGERTGGHGSTSV